jgi:hypothetical protein
MKIALKSIVCCSVLGCLCSCITPSSSHSDASLKKSSTKLEEAEMRDAFQKAIASTGTNYLKYEDILIRGNSDKVLRNSLTSTDPIVRLMAKAIFDQKEDAGSQLFKLREFLRYERNQRVVNWHAPDTGLLISTFDSKFKTLDRMLALYLAKDADLERYEKVALLNHFANQKSTPATDAIIRYLAQEQEPGTRKIAIAVLKHIGDPALPDKLKAEQKRLATQGKTLPGDLGSLRAN